MQYHSSHKRHIKSCEARCEALVQEEAGLQIRRVETPTPDPYTPILTDAEMNTENTAESSV
jgi:hypothetical protein